jgi:hypothetical protein
VSGPSQARVEGRRETEEASRSRAAARPSLPARVLALQRAAGNRTTAALLGAHLQRAIRVRNIDYDPKAQRFHQSPVLAGDSIVTSMKETGFWTRLNADEKAATAHLDEAPDVIEDDIPRLATSIINRLAPSAARRTVLANYRGELEYALGASVDYAEEHATVAIRKANPKEKTVFRGLNAQATTRSRAKGTAGTILQAGLPPAAQAWLTRLTGDLLARHDELNARDQYLALVARNFNAADAVSHDLAGREPHQNRARWLPDNVASQDQEPALDTAVRAWLTQVSNNPAATLHAELAAAFPVIANVTALQFENTQLSIGAKRAYYHLVLHATLPTRAEKARLAWRRYALQYLPNDLPDCPYIEFTAQNAGGLSRAVYDFVNDRIYVGVHYNWVDGFNPFFHVTDAAATY